MNQQTLVFIRTKKKGLDGDYITHTQMKSKDPMVIEATKYGIQFVSPTPVIGTQEDLQALAKVVSDAWKDHQMLRPKIVMS